MKTNLFSLFLIIALPVILAREFRFNGFKGKLGDVWENCTAPNGPMTINKATVSPDTVIKVNGQVSVFVSYKLTEDISGGTVSIDLEAGGTPLSTSVDLCDALGYINQECPLKKTDNGIFNVTQTIPGEAPTGQYSGKVTASTNEGKQFLCVKLHFKMES